MALPKKYEWLQQEGAPAMLVEAIKHYGILELVGKGSNPNITRWAKEVGVQSWYTDDDIPWCGLFVGVVAKRCGYAFPASKLLSARQWLNWGEPVTKGREMLWDVLVFSRPGGGASGGHVGYYAGETDTHFRVFGGNQSNKVGFAWIEKSRLLGARRPIYKIGEPKNVRKIFLTDDGEPVSQNES
jgi:uncharacterized protein (TIGR02594 family)